MAKRTLLKFRNLDVSRDLNDRFAGLIKPGVISGAEITTVSSQLKIDLHPYKLISVDGMVVIETSDTKRLSTPAGQTTVIAVRAIYYENNSPDIEEIAVELSAFLSLPNIGKHVVIAYVTPPALAIQVSSTDVNLSPQDRVDQLGRNTFRGILGNPGLLPPQNNVLGDYYMVVDGVGGLPNLHAWDNFQWLVLTDFVTLSSDLLNHRNNLFTDEKHLTDAEKLAVVGTSGTPVSVTNRLVDDADMRIPAQGENDALIGSDGSPSSLNRYVTEEFPISVAEEKASAFAPVNPFIAILLNEGPIFVGSSGTGSANEYFRFFNLLTSTQREYLTSTGAKVSVTGIYLDAGLTNEINPSTDPNVDSDGFFTGVLYVEFSTQPDSGFRLVYNKRYTLATVPIDALSRRHHIDAQTNADTLIAIERIKGRPFDIVPPTNEQNIELRKDIVDIKEYVGAVFRSDYVVSEFDKISGVPDFSGDFIENVGIPQNYVFQNTGLVGISYNATLGRVTYASAVAIGSVVPGNVFIDGSLEEFKIVTSNGSNQLTITKRNGLVPSTINSVITSSVQGCVKPDNNPRKVNLSTLDHVVGLERISIREIEPVLNEFNPVTGNVAFQVRKPLRTPFFPEPRVRLYGGFENRNTGTSSRVVCTGGTGRILVTGFFNDLHIITDAGSTSPTLTVRVDGDPVGANIDLSRSGAVANFGTSSDIQQQVNVLTSGLGGDVPHTVEIIVANATADFVLFGFDMWRVALSNTTILPGRAFVQSDLYKSDMALIVPTTTVGPARRGSVSKRFINRSLVQQTYTYDLADFDGTASTPVGIASSSSPNFTVTSGLAKFSNYKAGDVVKLITAAAEEVKVISVISPGNIITFSNNITVSGVAVLHHVASTTGEPTDPTQELFRHTVTDFGLGQLTDFSTPFTTPSDRTFTLENGTTSISGKSIKYITTGIDGIDIALALDNAGSEIYLRALCSQMDLLIVNSSPMTASISIDGSPVIAYPISGTGLIRVPILLNARYQTHEIIITSSVGLAIAGIILHEPTVNIKIEGTELSTQNFLARYVTSTTLVSNIIPTGAVAIDPFTMGATYVNGAGVGDNWVYSLDFTRNLAYGQYAETDREGSYIEFNIVGGGVEIEFWSNSNRGRPVLTLNGTIANSTNFPAATFRGMVPATGEIDMYSISLNRKRFSISGLPETRYRVRVQVQAPRQKNPASSGFFINATTIYMLNTGGAYSITQSRGYQTKDFITGIDSARDERNFDSGAVSQQQIPVLRTVLAQTRSQRVALMIATTSIAVAFTSAMTSTDFSVSCNLFNSTDSNPLYQPITITAVTPSGFTANWNGPLDTGNYYLSYTAIFFS